MALPKTIVYIDGFNFYYGCIKGTAYRWLNLFQFAERMLPGNDVVEVKYFTAIVKSGPRNASKSVRQMTYLRALEMIPEVAVYLGSFQANLVRRPRADGSGLVEVIDMKEKGFRRQPGNRTAGRRIYQRLRSCCYCFERLRPGSSRKSSASSPGQSGRHHQST